MDNRYLVVVDTREKMQLLRAIGEPDAGRSLTAEFIQEIKSLAGGDLAAVARARVERFTGKTVFTMR